jgi:hypothetical protein
MVSELVTGSSSSEEAVTQAAELLATDMTEGSCVLCLESLSRSALHQRFSQVRYDGVQISGRYRCASRIPFGGHTTKNVTPKNGITNLHE